jgi:hypothetical protein
LLFVAINLLPSFILLIDGKVRFQVYRIRDFERAADALTSRSLLGSGPFRPQTPSDVLLGPTDLGRRSPRSVPLARLAIPCEVFVVSRKKELKIVIMVMLAIRPVVE